MVNLVPTGNLKQLLLLRYKVIVDLNISGLVLRFDALHEIHQVINMIKMT